MPHEVEGMFYVGREPWHGLGVYIPEENKLSIEEAIAAAGLKWKVGLRHLYTKDARGIPMGLLNHYATCRDTDNTVLGIVGKDYKPLQNHDAVKWFQPFLDGGQAILETAGSLQRGAKVWVLARIRRDPLRVAGDDIVSHYLLLSNSHDGRLAVRVGFTPIRVVCHNTLCLAHESKASKLLRVRHTAGVKRNLVSIRETIDLAHREFTATVEQYRRLMGKGINRNDLVKYIRFVFPPKPKESNQRRTGEEKIVPKVIRLFEEGRGSRQAGRTYWGAYNAVNEYLNYFRGKNQDNTLKSLWFGSGAELNKRALLVALKMAA
jgi:phage/plasmid-like protein (TIGR03299 family)